MRCRHCGEPVNLVLVDLGSSPPANSYLTDEGLRSSEAWFPLRVLVCESCWRAKRKGQSVVGYGAAAKGNTLLNYAGVGPDLISYVVDNNPAKQGRYLPGSRIPIVDEQRIVDDPPDLVLVLPWNIRDEIARRLESLDGWSGSVVTAVPELRVR